MTKLETLYASIKGLEKVGLTLTDEMLKKADELEEQRGLGRHFLLLRCFVLFRMLRTLGFES